MTFEKMEAPNTEMWAFPADRRSGEVGGAAVGAEGAVPSATGTVVFLNADPDLQVVLDRVEGAGGKVLMPKTAIGTEAGHFAMIADTEGDTMGLHSLGRTRVRAGSRGSRDGRPAGPHPGRRRRPRVSPVRRLYASRRLASVGTLARFAKEKPMTVRRLVPLAVIVACAALALALGAWSWSARTVTVTHDGVTGTLVDNGAPGASVGDVRLFEIATAFKGGKTPGRLDAAMTTTGSDVPEPGSEIRMAQLIFTFRTAEDQIVVSGVSVYPAAGSTIATASSTIRPIVGGSGAYNGARGWCESFHLADGTWRHVFHLER